ncbi:Alkylglycerol monooxygenase [Fragariocoptes setiger]|uniref:Alkylglycerol monooxygenase n=1 Tax=Fragariocoptes setiger TaxID=1670756 RepID=A0ABQ7SCI3_9ACAR|nr:Alkylglycerol monooxygenase [Fragariocoptes setiger]
MAECVANFNNNNYLNLTSTLCDITKGHAPLLNNDILSTTIEPREYVLESVMNCSIILWHIIHRMRYMFFMVWPTETMYESLEQVPRYVTEMFPVFVFMSVIENAVKLIQGKHLLRVNESIGSLSAGIFQECFRIKIRSIEVIMYCLVYDNLRMFTLPWDSLWTWWLCYIGVDFGFYWAHKIAHAHHSSEEFSIVSALRQAVLQPLTAWMTYMPLALCIPPQIFLAHLQLSELFMAWLHTEVIHTLGPLEYILNTPSHHRVHHSRNRQYVDKNYGGILIIWDRLFGTFAREDPADPPVYGLVHPVKSFNPFYVQFHHWHSIYKRLKRTSGWRNKLYVLIKGPGWQPKYDNWLGDYNDIPEIQRPVNVYNPVISLWQTTYVVVHFAAILLFYHELTMRQLQFCQTTITIGICGLIWSITSIGFLLEDRWFAPGVELARCFVFIPLERYLLPIVVAGIDPQPHYMWLRIGLIELIRFIYMASTFIQTLKLFSNLLQLYDTKTRNFVVVNCELREGDGCLNELNFMSKVDKGHRVVSQCC